MEQKALHKYKVRKNALAPKAKNIPTPDRFLKTIDYHPCGITNPPLVPFHRNTSRPVTPRTHHHHFPNLSPRPPGLPLARYPFSSNEFILFIMSILH